METKVLNKAVKLAVTLLTSSISLYAADAIDARDVINNKCTACHSGNLNEGLSRISHQRKTPEGWLMTVTRMESSHGLYLTKDEKKSVVKYLADTQGLNPSESEPYRYILEKSPNYQEKSAFDSTFTQMCVRCHSEARVGLQRRDKAEWNSLVNFHLGQFPTLEYQALSRDREWLSLAKEQIVPFLDKNFNNDTEFEKIEGDYEGSWTLFGHKLGDGDFSATMSVTKLSKDNYKLTLNGEYADGRALKGSGKAVVYSGYEWRASLNIDGVSFKQVFAMNPKTLELKGSMFESLHPEEHSKIVGVNKDIKESRVLGVSPKSIKSGESQIITITGANLDKSIKLSKGLKLEKVIEKSSDKLVLKVSSKSGSNSMIDLTIGSKTFEDSFVVYNKIDSLKVFPQYAIARVGDGGGTMPKQHAIFEAHGYLAGEDGKIGTSDDISLGAIDASWSVAPFDERAHEDEDVKFTGKMDSFSGRFTPSFAGPNPKRRFGTNNAGNLKVIATYKDGEESLNANSHLIVTVQKWVNPPIN